MKKFLFLSSILLLLQIKGKSQDMLFNKDLVYLKGKPCFTILKNSTTDTLKIRGKSFYYLPYYETEIKLAIPPQQSDTIEVSLAYPDFIYLNSLGIHIWNAPGKAVECDFKSFNSGKWDISFGGDLVQVNNYYLDYQNEYKNFSMETTAYYKVGSRITDFNTFPALADSITRQNLSFLNNYKKSLPEWFIKHEAARLKYNGGYRKYHVPFDKEFWENKKIALNPDYYSFEKSLPLKAENMVLNTEYLWFACYRLMNKTKAGTIHDKFTELDSLVGQGMINDVIKMRLLSNVYKTLKSEYEDLMSSAKFFDDNNKVTVDSITTRKNRYPLVGSIAPELTLSDITGKRVSLHSFAGKPVLINFWASWCMPCLKELPHENALYRNYSKQGLVVINVCVETDQKKWETISMNENLSMINLFASQAEYEKIRASYNIEELPRTILINKNLIVEDNYFKKASSLTLIDIEGIIKD